MRYFIYLMMLLLIGDAQAATNLFTPVSNDISVQLLNAIFPGLTGSGGADAVASAMGIFNGCVLMLGGVLATYTILAGTVGTAHDGEMLGKKFSSIWIPIRYSIGTALVLPIVGGGYNIMQSLVMWCVMQSIGLADNVWSEFVSSQNIANIAVTSIQNPDAKQLAYTTLNIETCMAALTWVKSNGDQVIDKNMTSGMTKDDGVINKTYYFGDPNETHGLKKDTCGKVTFSKFVAPVQTAPGFTNFITSFGNASNIINAQESQYTALAASIAPIAAELFKTKKPADPAQMTVIINTYQSSVAKFAANMVTSSDAFSDLSKNASQDGWGGAGFWFVKLSNLMDLVNRSLAAIPVAQGPSTESASSLEYYADALPAIMSTFDKGGANMIGMGMGNEDGGSNTSWWQTIKSSIKNLDVTVIIKKAFTSSMNYTIQDGEHPLMALKRLGNTTLGIASAGFIASLGALSTFGNLPGVGIAIGLVMTIVVVPLATVGITLSYIIPFMPALIWISILIGWFIQVIEGVIASSIWAVMHLHPSGDEVGKGGNGYSLTLGILFRPVLSVFGLIAALLTMQIFGQFINKVFADAFLVAQQDSGLFVWLIGLIIAPCMYAISMWTIVKKLFEIVHIIPDQLMQWIGGSNHSLGDYAKTMGSGGDHGQMTNVAVGAVGQVGNNLANGAGLKGGGKEPGLKGDPVKNGGQLGSGQQEMKNMLSGAGSDSKKGQSESAMKLKSNFDGKINDLSSANPELANGFKENLSQMSENPSFSNLSSNELMDKAMETTVRQNYGQGAVSALKNFAGGGLSGEKFQQGLGMYENAKSGAVADHGSFGYKKEMMGASSAINNEFAANASREPDAQMTPEQIFSNHLGKFNDVDAVVQSPVAPAVTETPVASNPVATNDAPAVVQTPVADTSHATHSFTGETPAVEKSFSDEQFKV